MAQPFSKLTSAMWEKKALRLEQELNNAKIREEALAIVFKQTYKELDELEDLVIVFLNEDNKGKYVAQCEANRESAEKDLRSKLSEFYEG